MNVSSRTKTIGKFVAAVVIGLLLAVTPSCVLDQWFLHQARANAEAVDRMNALQQQALEKQRQQQQQQQTQQVSPGTIHPIPEPPTTAPAPPK